MHRRFKLTSCFNSKSIIFLGMLFSSSSAFSNGLEKGIMWSGHYAGIVNAASSSVAGPESLYFNPAGLAGGEGLSLNANFSPTFAQFSGPFISGTTITGDRNFLPIAAAFANYGISQKFGVGLGYYVSGGTRASYTNLNFGSNFAALTPTAKADLTISELSAGAGYEILDGLKLGATYRIVFVNGSLASPRLISGANPTLLAMSLDALSATNFNGFSVGAQYSPKNSGWGLGLNYRSQLVFNATGTASGTGLTPGLSANTYTTTSSSSVTVSDTFPQQLSLGGHFDVVPDVWRVFAQYSFTEYVQDRSLVISGNLNFPAPLGTVTIPSIDQNWNNMHNLRLGVQYTGIPSWAFRAGYVYTSQVVPKSDARPTFFPPGIAHTIALGAGADLIPNLSANLALEYSFGSATVGSADVPAGLSTATGDYSVNAFAAHLGVTYQL